MASSFFAVRFLSRSNDIQSGVSSQKTGEKMKRIPCEIIDWLKANMDPVER